MKKLIILALAAIGFAACTNTSMPRVIVPFDGIEVEITI